MQKITKCGKILQKMTKYGEICRWKDEMWRNIGKIWQGTGKIRRDLAEKCGILTESGEKQRNLAKKGEIWRNILKIKKWQNVTKFETNDEVWQNLSMKWQNVAEFGWISAKFGKLWRATGEIRRHFDRIWRNLAKSGDILAIRGEIWRKMAKSGGLSAKVGEMWRGRVWWGPYFRANSTFKGFDQKTRIFGQYAI